MSSRHRCGELLRQSPLLKATTSVELTEQNPTLLLIDDSPMIHRLLIARLKNEQIDVVSAQSGAEGIHKARDLQPSIILLDLNMPRMDGFEVLRLLKDYPATMDIPVIVVSGSDQSEDKVRGLDLGAVDYVCKPFDLPELRARVRSALRISELMTLLAQKAQIDGLTSLWNRQYFDERLADELAAKERCDRPLSLAICDLDNFKSLNDTFGHAAGDVAIQEFSRILRRTMRRSDIACRYGGEEFALILRDTPAEQAASLLERVRSRLESKSWARHPDRKVTASFGVCDSVQGPVNDPTKWIETADAALYSAKTGGRNRVCIAGEKVTPAQPLNQAG